MIAENEDLTNQQENAEPEKKDAKPSKAAKKKKESDGFHLPVLVEFTFTVSVVLLVIVFLAMAAISWMTGTSLLDFVLRTSTSMLVLGGLLMVVTRQVSTGVMEAKLGELEDMLRQPSDRETKDSPEKDEVPENTDDVETEENPEAQ